MTTKEVLEIVKARGMRIEIRDGRPVLIRKDNETDKLDKLLAVLAFHRERIIQELSKGSG